MSATSGGDAASYLDQTLQEMRDRPEVDTEPEIDLGTDYGSDDYDLDVLVVEDYEMQRDLNRDLLENSSEEVDPRVLTAPNELVAWSLMRDGYLPDVVLTDRDLSRTGGETEGGDNLAGAVKAGTPWEDQMDNYETPYVVMYSGTPPEESEDVRKLLDETWKKQGETGEKIKSLLDEKTYEQRSSEDLEDEYSQIEIPGGGNKGLSEMEEVLEESRKTYGDGREDVMIEAGPVLRDAKSTANMIRNTYESSLHHINRFNDLVKREDIDDEVAQGALASAAYGLATSKMAYDEFLQKEQLMSVSLEEETYSKVKQYSDRINSSLKEMELKIDGKIEELKESEQDMHQGLARISSHTDEKTETNLPGILDWNDPKENLSETLVNIDGYM